MPDRIKNIIIAIGFSTILILVMLSNILKKDEAISKTERRKLAQFPDITIEKVISGETMENWEKYAVDQFVVRDALRGLKSFCSINIFKQKDNNGLFEKDGAIYKIEYPLNINNINKSADRIKEVYDKYLQGMNVYYAIIPDKNYYLGNDDHLKIDYTELRDIMENKLTEIKYIDIWDSLNLEDYYRTDLHWKQVNLQDVVNKIKKDMNIEVEQHTNYQIIEMGDFYGTYYGQLGIKVLPDKLYILTNETLENCTTYNYENKKTGKIYENSKTADKYDIYLSGATPLISIENPNANTEKELLLFRDSFGSSIAPLLIENYKKITLIDLRYMSSKLLETYINFENQDVLFLYSTVVLNQNILK